VGAERTRGAWRRRILERARRDATRPCDYHALWWRPGDAEATVLRRRWAAATYSARRLGVVMVVVGNHSPA
jgi:hypothetical protein